MSVEALAISDVKLITPPRYKDPRGFFSETWKQGAFAEAGVPGPFIQDNLFACFQFPSRSMH